MFRLSNSRRNVPHTSVRRFGLHKIAPLFTGHKAIGSKRVHLLRAAGSNNSDNGGSSHQQQESRQQQLHGTDSMQVDQTQMLFQAQQQQLAEMQKQMLAMQQIMISQQQQNQKLMEAMAQMAATKQAQGASVPSSSPERPSTEWTEEPPTASAVPMPGPTQTPAPTQPKTTTAGASSTPMPKPTPVPAPAQPHASKPMPAPIPAHAPTQPQAADASASAATTPSLPEAPPSTKDTSEAAPATPLPPPPPLLWSPSASSPPPPPPPTSARQRSTPPQPNLRKIPVSPPPSIFRPPISPQQTPAAPVQAVEQPAPASPSTLATASSSSSAAAAAATTAADPQAGVAGSAASGPQAAGLAARAAAAATETETSGLSAPAAGSSVPGQQAPEPEAPVAGGSMVGAAVSSPTAAPSGPIPQPVGMPPPSVQPPLIDPQQPSKPPAAAAPSAPTPQPVSPPSPQPPPINPRQPPKPPAAAAAERPAVAPKMGHADDSAAVGQMVSAAASPPAAAPSAPTPQPAPPPSWMALPSLTTPQPKDPQQPSVTKPSVMTPPQQQPSVTKTPASVAGLSEILASKLRHAASGRSPRSQKGLRSESTQLPSGAYLNQMVASVIPDLDKAAITSLTFLLKQVVALSSATGGGTQLTPTHLAELARSLARRIDAIDAIDVSVAQTMSTPAIWTPATRKNDDGSSSSITDYAHGPALLEQAPELLQALAQLVPASAWPQPISVRVLDPLHKWTYLDVAARLLRCVQASRLSGALAALRSAAAIHHQHTQTNAASAVSKQPPTSQAQPSGGLQGVGSLEASASALVKRLFGAEEADAEGGDVNGAGVAGALQQRNAARLADTLLACTTLRVQPSSLRPLLEVLVLRLDELDADRLANVGKVLLSLGSFGSLNNSRRSMDLEFSSSGSSNSSSKAEDTGSCTGDGVGMGVLAAWPGHFVSASMSQLQLDSSSSSSSSSRNSNGRKGIAADGHTKQQKGQPVDAYGLDTLAALAHVMACTGVVPGMGAFDRRLRALLGLLPGQPAADASVSSTGLAQLCSAAATFMIAEPSFEKLRGSCARRLQSLLEAKISEGGRASNSMRTSGDGSRSDASRSGVSAAELVDALWGLNVMGQRPSDNQLNFLVIMGTPQLGSLSCTSLVRAMHMATRGSTLNLKWWDSLQRSLLASLSSPSSMTGNSTLAERHQQQQRGGGAAVLSKHEILELLTACESAERLAAKSGTKAGSAAKSNTKGTPHKASSRGGGGGTPKGETSGVVALPLARVLLQSAHELACTGELEQAEVVKVVEDAASLEVVSSEGGLLSTQLLQEYEAATNVAPTLETIGWPYAEANSNNASVQAAASMAAERSCNVAWVMAQSGHMPTKAWRSAFVDKVTGVVCLVISPRGLLRALGAMHKLKACDAPIDPAWISSAITCIADPQALHSASPLELVRACLALQTLEEKLQEQQQQEHQQQQEGQQQQGQYQQREQPQLYAGGLRSGELKERLLQEMVRKLHAGPIKAMAVGDVGDVLQVCFDNGVELGKPLGAELMRFLSQNAETMSLDSLILATNAAAALRLQAPPQQLQGLLETLVRRTHAALTLSEGKPLRRPDLSPSTTASSPATSGDTEMGKDAHSQLIDLLTVLSTCKTYGFVPAPLQLAAFMARTEDLLGSCQADIRELNNIVFALLTFEILPSDMLLNRLATSLQTAPTCSPESDAEMLSDLIKLHLFGVPKNSNYMRVVGEANQRLLQELQKARSHEERGELQLQQQGDRVVPSETLLMIVPGLIKLDMKLGPLVELCLEELAENCRMAVALEVQAQRSGQPAVKNGVLHPSMLSGFSSLFYGVMRVSEMAQAGKQGSDPEGEQTDGGQELQAQPAVLKCREILKLVEEWASLKLPLLSAGQMMELCSCFSFLGMAPAPELTQLMQPHIMSGLQNADPDKAFELLVFFYNKVLHASPGDMAGAAAAEDQPEGSSSSSSRKGVQSTRPSSKKSVQDGARDVCCAALKRVMALKTVTDEGEILDLRANSPNAYPQIMPNMGVARLILCLDYMKELGMGPFSSQWQNVLQKTVAAFVLEQEVEPEIMNRLVCATMAIMPPGHSYSSWWSAIVHLACAQRLVDKVPEEVESTIAPYIMGATQEEQQQNDKAVQAEILEAEKFLNAREQQGGLSRKEQRELQEARAQILEAKQLHQQQQQQQQQREDGTTYGIPAAPQADALPPYSEAVKGLDDMLGSLTSSTNSSAQPSPDTRPGATTIDVTPQSRDATQSNSSLLPDADSPVATADVNTATGNSDNLAAIVDAVMDNAGKPVLALPPSKAVPLLTLCMTLPHTPRQEWMQMLWAAVMPSVQRTAVAGGAAQEDSMAWFDAEQHWDLHALGMLGMLSMRAGFNPGWEALETLAHAAAPQFLPSGVAPQTAIAILQVLARFRYSPGDAWLHRFAASTQPVLHILMPSPTGEDGPGSVNTQASTALASALTCLANLNWPPPLEWLAIYYTVLYKGGHVQRLSHGLLWSTSASLAKMISLQAQQQQQSSGASEGQVPVPRQLVNLLADEITARCTGDAAGSRAEQKVEIGPDDAERLSQALHVLRML